MKLNIFTYHYHITILPLLCNCCNSDASLKQSSYKLKASSDSSLDLGSY